MRIRTNQTGFSPVEALIIIAVVAVVGLAGFAVYNRRHTQTASTSVSQSSADQSATANDVPSAPNVSSTSDLDKAAATLDQTDPSASNNVDARQLNSQLANF